MTAPFPNPLDRPGSRHGDRLSGRPAEAGQDAAASSHGHTPTMPDPRDGAAAFSTGRQPIDWSQVRIVEADATAFVAAEVSAVRADQIARGFTAQADAQGPDCFLERQAEKWIYRARLDREKGRDPAEPARRAHALRAARRNYARAAAVLLAAIERIDWILAHLETEEN